MFPWLSVAYHKIVTIHPFTENTQELLMPDLSPAITMWRYLNLWILALSKYMPVVRYGY